MSNPIQERLVASLQKAKATGSTRASRIGAIVKEAASQTLTEIKVGSGEIGAIAQETLIPGTENNAAADLPAESPSLPALLVRLFQAVKTQLSSQFQPKYAEVQRQVTQLKERANHLDLSLTERYGDRYTTTKQRLEAVRTDAGTWYANTRMQAEAQGVDPLQQQQEQVKAKAAEAGTFVARREQQVRQQLKTLLQNTAAKL